MRLRYTAVFELADQSAKLIYLCHIYAYSKYTVKAYLGSSRE